MKRILLFLIIFCVCAHYSKAQKFIVSVPTEVSTGENVKLTYTINTQNVSDFRVGNIPKELEIITGPYISQQSSYQMVNGHTSGTSSITYTFILSAAKSGTYTIPAAHINVNGKRISSKAVKIRVTGNSVKHGSGAPRMHEDVDDRPRMRDAGTPITGSDLFIKVSANKQRVKEQEVVLLTYKVYSLVDLTELEGNMPDLTGFHTQEIPLPQQKSFHIERVNGRAYRCVTWKQYAMYPQMTGNLEIPSITFIGTVIQQNRNIDPFEAFFNGGSGYVEVKRKIKAPGVTIKVDPLPTRPTNFSGGVGKLNISAQINKKEVKANDPISIRVVVGGIGNLKLIKQPVVKFPKDFDKYDAKITDKTKLTSNGVEGNMIYDFLAVPRNHGRYVIPSIEFVYYDTSLNTYKTLKTQSFNIDVAKGSGTDDSSADVTALKNMDIHPIMEEEGSVMNIDNIFYGSAYYWLVLSALLFVFIGLLIVFRKQAVDNADITNLKVKKANRIATKRLKYANKLLMSGQHDKFYDEVLRALWGYVGDKLKMPVEQLSRDNISESLSSKNVDNNTVLMFIKAIDECEFNRYAPGDQKGNMNQTFEAAMTAIIEIENTLKKSKKCKNIKIALMLMFVLFSCNYAYGVTKQNADDEYKKGNYQQAIKDYEELLKMGPNMHIYYNLGNAYYKTDNITHAVLNYERALLLSPGNGDIRFNLQMARSKTIDKISPKSEMFFVTWYKTVVNLTSVDQWARISITAISLTLILVLCYLFSKKLILRKVGFYGAILSMVIFIFSNIFAYEQKKILTNRNGAIIVVPSVTMRKTPVSTGEQSAVVHEGTKVEIIDDTMKDWKLVELGDGRMGWLKTSNIERI